MILCLLSVECPRHHKHFEEFAGVTRERYTHYLAHRIDSLRGGVWFCAIKPYHTEAFPFLVLDLLIHLRGLPCKVFFGQDLLPYGDTPSLKEHLGGPLAGPVAKALETQPTGVAALRFQGFGPRIDLALNALGALYCELLASLTRVEADVLAKLREFQHLKYQTPTDARSFGLQKQVALALGKSPVAVHKSLRTAKYDLITRTAHAIRDILA